MKKPWDAPLGNSPHLWSTNYEASRRLDVVHSLLIQVLLRDDNADYFFHDFLTQLLQSDLLRVLDRHDHSVDALGHTSSLFHAVLTGNLQVSNIGSDCSSKRSLDKYYGPFQYRLRCFIIRFHKVSKLWYICFGIICLIAQNLTPQHCWTL